VQRQLSLCATQTHNITVPLTGTDPQLTAVSCGISNNHATHTPANDSYLQLDSLESNRQVQPCRATRFGSVLLGLLSELNGQSAKCLLAIDLVRSAWDLLANLEGVVVNKIPQINDKDAFNSHKCWSVEIQVEMECQKIPTKSVSHFINLAERNRVFVYVDCI